MADRSTAWTVKTPYDADAEGAGGELLLAVAWLEGYVARRRRRPFKSPLPNYPSPRIPKAWEEGWRAANEEIEERIPRISVQQPPIVNRDA